MRHDGAPFGCRMLSHVKSFIRLADGVFRSPEHAGRICACSPLPAPDARAIFRPERPPRAPRSPVPGGIDVVLVRLAGGVCGIELLVAHVLLERLLVADVQTAASGVCV